MSQLMEIRKRLKLTQADLGAVIGCSQGNVGFYERQEQEMPVSRAEALIEYAKQHGLALTLDQVYGRKALPAQKARA